jgi:hypothetical protein
LDLEDERDMGDGTRSFRDPGSDDDEVLRAISRMTTGDVPATVWTEVANDPSYRPFHRAVAVQELFKRQVRRPMTLDQVAVLLAGGRWLLDASIEKVESMGGEIPVRVPAGGAAFVLRLPRDPGATRPELGIYLALDRPLDAEPLRDALLSRATDPSVGQIRIVDLAVFPDSLAPANYH